MEIEQVIDNIAKVKADIEKIKSQCGYDYDITLIGVTKTKPCELSVEIQNRGLLGDVGENYVQELVEKYPFAPHLNWHFVGQLQSNKVKYIIDKVALIHSLDRESLAIEIEKQAVKHNKNVDCLIEINMGSELSKGGIDKGQLESFARFVDDKCPHIRLRGVMAIMPNLGECDELKELFEESYKEYELLNNIVSGRHKIDIRSCGMTNDFEYAIRYAKATHIRIGRALFGARQ